MLAEINIVQILIKHILGVLQTGSTPPYQAILLKYLRYQTATAASLHMKTIDLVQRNNKLQKAKQGPVVQSIVSLTSSLRVISLTVLADSIYNILIFFAEKM